MNFLELHTNIKVRLITIFLTKSISSMFFPFLAIYLADQFGITTAGILVLINILITTLVSLYGGYISDKFGRKKIMIAGQSIQIFSYMLMALFNSPLINSAVLTYVSINLIAVAGGLIGPAADAMLIDVSKKENRKLIYTIHYWILNLSMAIGVLIGGLFFKDYKFELFSFFTLVSVFTLYLMIFYMYETNTLLQNQKKSKDKLIKNIYLNYKTVAQNKRFIIFLFASVCLISLEFQIYNYIAIRLTDEFVPIQLDFFNNLQYELTGLRLVSWISFESTFLVVILSLLVLKYFKEANEIKVFYIALTIYTTAFVIFGSSNSLVLLLIAAALQSIGEIFYVPIRQSMMADLIPEQNKASYLAVNSLTFKVAKISGALGIIIGVHSPQYAMSILYLLLGILSMVLFYYSVFKTETHSESTTDLKVSKLNS